MRNVTHAQCPLFNFPDAADSKERERQDNSEGKRLREIRMDSFSIEAMIRGYHISTDLYLMENVHAQWHVTN